MNDFSQTQSAESSSAESFFSDDDALPPDMTDLPALVHSQRVADLFGVRPPVLRQMVRRGVLAAPRRISANAAWYTRDAVAAAWRHCQLPGSEFALVPAPTAAPVPKDAPPAPVGPSSPINPAALLLAKMSRQTETAARRGETAMRQTQAAMERAEAGRRQAEENARHSEETRVTVDAMRIEMGELKDLLRAQKEMLHAQSDLLDSERAARQAEEMARRVAEAARPKGFLERLRGK